MRLTCFAGCVIDQGISERGGFLGHVQAARIEVSQGIEGCRGLAGDPEGIEHMNGSEVMAGSSGNPGVFAFGIDADYRAIGGEQIGDEGADPLAAACRGHG